jgi:hypothetical protein
MKPQETVCLQHQWGCWHANWVAIPWALRVRAWWFHRRVHSYQELYTWWRARGFVPVYDDPQMTLLLRPTKEATR